MDQRVEKLQVEGSSHSGGQQQILEKLGELFDKLNSQSFKPVVASELEQFFQFYQTLLEDHVALASFHLEGDAQLWYQLVKQEKGCYDMARVSRWHQYKVCTNYQTQFEKLLSKVGYLPQDSQVSCFINGLRDIIKADMLAK
ncbi:hypothetical protein ACOSQ2_027212 [Xanthoceras sorbifolium]